MARVKTLRRLHETRRELEARRLAAEVEPQGGAPQGLRALRFAAARRAHHRRRLGRAAVPAAAPSASTWWRCSPTCAASRASPRRIEVDNVVDMLNEYFAVLTEAAYQHEGTIFNMAGDSLLVGFNVPFAQPDAAARAWRTAQDMVTRFAPVCRRLDARAAASPPASASAFAAARRSSATSARRTT